LPPGRAELRQTERALPAHLSVVMTDAWTMTP
jgi:hypothetical protein